MLRFAVPCLLLSACQCATLPDGARFTCSAAAPCSTGFVCVNELCQPAGAGGGTAGSGEGGGTGGGATAGGTGGVGGGSGSFTWENPAPFGHAINAMASRGSELLAVGDYGLVLHYDGMAWRRENPATTSDLRSVAFAPSGYALVVAEKGVLLWRAPAGAWSAVAGSGSGSGEHRTAVWSETKGQFIIGGDGVAQLHSVGIGGSLQPLDGPVTSDLTVRSIDSSLGLATEAAIFRYDAGGWSEERRQAGDDLFAIDGTWAAGFSNTSGNGQVLARDAGSWSVVPFATTGGPRYRALAATADGGCFAVGEQGLAYSCSDQQRQDFTPIPDIDLYAVTGEWHAAGRAAVVGRYESGKGWSLIDIGVKGERCDRLNGIAGASADNVWAGGTSSLVLLRQADAGWSPRGGSGLPSTIHAVAAASNGDVWLVGNQGQVKVFFADGNQSAWGITSVNLTAAAATPGYGWVGGPGGFFGFFEVDAGVWVTGNLTATTWTGIATRGAGAPNETFFVGGELFRNYGTGVMKQRIGASLNDIWISPNDEIFIAGGEADGGALLLQTQVSAPETLRTVDVSCARGPFVAIHGTSLTDLWLVEYGAPRAVVHFTGTTCERVSVPHSSALTDVFATPTDVWLTGRDCAVFHLQR